MKNKITNTELSKVVEKQVAINDLLVAILRINGIEPDQRTNSGQTTLERLEGAIMGCLDEIED